MAEEAARGRFARGEGVSGAVLRTGLPRVVQDIDAEPDVLCRSVERSRLPRETVSFIAVPLREGDRVLGVLAAHRLRRRTRALNDDLELLQTIGTLTNVNLEGGNAQSISGTATLTNLTPVVVTLVGWWLFRERPRALFLVALAAAIAGAVTMSLGADGGQGSNPPLGDVFAGKPIRGTAFGFLFVLAIVGGLFVVETVSVIVQVASFKLTGRRVFRMAPLHHHFEKKGWKEPTIVIRFWIIAIILALAGLSTLKLR